MAEFYHLPLGLWPVPNVPPYTSTTTSSGFRDVLPTGTRIGGYEIRSVLGRGGFGITYRAHDIALAREVAIKEFLPTSLAIRESGALVVPRSTDMIEEFVHGRDKFLDEARTLAKLDRIPAVVRVHGFFEENGTAYMVMALADGETLERRLKRVSRLAGPEIERLLFPLLDGLELVHGAGFLHRDIKPSNIVLDGHGFPTLIDFGAARAALAGRTVEMTAVFTPGYAAVEQFSSAKQGPWTDIYGLSATLYHAIVGQAPPSAFDRILEDRFVSLKRAAPAGVTADLLQGLDAGLAVRADDRPQSIGEWRTLLKHDSRTDDRKTILLQDPTSAWPVAPKWLWQKSRMAALAVGIGLVVAIAAGLPLAIRQQPTKQPVPYAQTTAEEARLDEQSACLDTPDHQCFASLLKAPSTVAPTTSHVTSCSTFTSVRGQSMIWKDLWTTSVYSYAPGGGTPGGGLVDGELKVGGWGDWYYSLLSVDLAALPSEARGAALVLFSLQTGGTPTGMHVDRVTSAWAPAPGDRFWWRDLPQAIVWTRAPAPARNGWYVLDITGLYQGWKSGRFTNNGLQLRPLGNNNEHNLFVSSRGNDRRKRPALLACN